MKITIQKQWEIRTADGKVKRTRKKRCNSYVLAFLDLLRTIMTGTASVSTLDTSNTARNVSQSTNNLGTWGIVGDINYGPVVGTGSTAVALADYKLVTRIAHGVGAGQLQYAATTFTAAVTSGTTRRFTIIRSFTNSSGASITINETGIYCMGGSTPWYFCAERALESPGVAIANGATGTLTYTISITV